ncbi:protein phosphatase 1 regulatory subunit 36-like [Acropora millepora]|uniref:protein phosphatase 1 regulatory subunit 36-like n=1 Tax=Acropora millepora TaxID=45264 RepID=UPI001CF2EB65|nr:protein phosphatase 1 regulatory subunit 36-like [Acropora millepora]
MTQADDIYKPSTLSRRWIWKDETNTIEAVSTIPGSIDKGANFLTTNKAKKNKGVSGIHFQDLNKKNERGTPSVLSKNYGAAGALSRRGQAYLMFQRAGNIKGSSPRPSIKAAGANEHATVTLEDVKSVALDSIPDGHHLPSTFQECYSSEQFDEFQLAILNYFDAFFETMAIENKPKPMAVEPSLVERKALATAISKQEAAQRLLGQSYCTLVLGLGLEDKHHLACGRQRNSDTNRDRDLFEALYTFAAYVTYITFRRQHLDLIQKELGRMFRSDTFNPAGRPQAIEEVYAIDRLKDNTKKPLTPAEYRRLKPKRPPIKSIIGQRSPVLVSLLPTSQEASPWFLDRSKALPLSEDEIPHEENRLELHMRTKVGIIGEPISGFNPLTLAPFGEEQEEETGVEDSSREGILPGEASVTPNQRVNPPEEEADITEQGE